MSKHNADPDTYLFKIDSKGDISAHLDQFIAAQESYAAAICLNVDDEGMRPFFLHLDDAELQSRHLGTVRKPAIQNPLALLLMILIFQTSSNSMKKIRTSTTLTEPVSPFSYQAGSTTSLPHYKRNSNLPTP